MSTLTLSSKNQMVVPKEVRKRLHLGAGDKIVCEVENDYKASIVKSSTKGKSVVDELCGLGKEVWDALGGADKYINDERNAWDRS